jgi:hypothetical protein
MKSKTVGSRALVISTVILLASISDSSWSQTDIVLSETWVPGSHEVINCKGGTIRPAVPATESGGVASPSVPDTLIYLKDVNGVKIRNCVLEDTTIGIFVVGGGGHSIGDNSIDAASIAISVTASHYNSLTNNSLAATVASIAVTNGSIGNLVFGNELTFKPGPDQIKYPGLPDLAGFQYQLITGSENMGGVINIIVNDELTQVPATVDNFAEDTLVLQNTVHNDGGTNGIGFAVRSRGSKAIANTVNGGEVGLLAAGYPDGDPGPFTLPGNCSLDSGRYCATDADCDLPGFDPVPLGACAGATQLLSESRRTIASEFANNTVTGAFEGIVAAWTDGVLIEGNVVLNNIFGIDLVGGYALEEGTIRGNIVSGNVYGFAILNFLGRFAGLDLSYNDFGDNDFPVDAIQFISGSGFEPYTLPTSLPNNWWGISCNEGGFPSSPQWPNTSDPTPFAEPVAEAYRINENKARKKAKCW